MAGGWGPYAGWARRDKIAFWVCIAIGIGVTEAVGESIRSSLDFWPAFAIKVAAGGVTIFVAFLVWSKLGR